MAIGQADGKMNGVLYILKSLINGRYYIGSTIDLPRRLIEHNSGKSKYTNLTRPFELVFNKEFNEVSDARRIEYKLKKFKSRKILEKIISDGTLIMDS